MFVRLLFVGTLALLSTVPPGRAGAQPRSYPHGARPAHAHAGPVAQNPRYGYSENPYDPTYRGPGWEVFALQHGQEQRAGVLHEIAPDAKISASGIVVGGE